MSATMRAVHLVEFGAAPRVVEVPRPEPGPGEVVIKVTAAGLCHSDLGVMARSPEEFSYGPLPLALGHESVGQVAALGEGVHGVELGESVAVYGPWGCGRCHACARGRENACTNAAGIGIAPPGLGGPGGLAEFQLIDDVRHLVPIGDLDPVTCVSLTDAGLTSYSAIVGAREVLLPGSTSVVIGVGGLGHVALQLLRAISPTRVVVVDVSDSKLALAASVGADARLGVTDSTADDVLLETGLSGAALVLDFVGSVESTALAAAVVGQQGEVRVVGAGSGAVPIGYRTTAFDVGARFPYWGTLPELYEVIALAAAGDIRVHTEEFTLDDVPAAYERLAAGEILGRAVAVP